MQIETNNWQAFSLATDALRDIDRFVSSPSKNRIVLVDAKEKLRNAVDIDPNFSRAQYYSAIVSDLLGQPAQAVSELEKLIASNPVFKEEAQYNLGVSYYHLYSSDQIDKAVTEFEQVAQQTSDAALKYMAKAGLVRSFAMKVLHNGLAGNQAASDKAFELTISTSQELLAAIKSDSVVPRKVRAEIQWRALNGRGVGRMFHSDNEPDLRAREASLDLARKDFEAADEISANNWEIVCNLGSVWMRLGSVAKLSGKTEAANTEFAKARAYLQEVVDRIRPNYGFALYEIGRVCRLGSDFAGAKDWFERSLQIPAEERNINEGSLRAEIDKANAGSDIFP